MPNSIFKKQLSPIKPGDPIDYKDVELLKKFITERGKILPRRMTGLTSKQQRDLTLAVKRARIVALLPFVNPEGQFHIAYSQLEKLYLKDLTNLKTYIIDSEDPHEVDDAISLEIKEGNKKIHN